MRIRNDHPEPRLVPALHLEVEPGAAANWPADTPIPDGFTAVPADRKPVKPTTAPTEPQPEAEAATTQQEQ